MKILFFFSFLLTMSACSKGSGVDEDKKDDSDANYYKKNVLVMEFVSFDCVYCPRVHKLLKEASEKDHPGRIDIVSVHGRLEDPDPMEFSGYRQFQNYFYAVTGYPAVILDQRDDLVTIGSFDVSGSAFSGRLNARSPIGIALSSASTGDNTVRVDVRGANKGKTNGDYRLAVAVLENDIDYKQADLVDGSLKWLENYKHSNVLRSYLSESYFGDPIGSLAENGSYSKSFNYTIPAGYKKENLTFVAYVIEASGFSNRVAVNSRTVAVGKSIDLQGEVR